METGKFGKHLQDIYGHKFKIYYDHGDATNDKHVAACKGYFNVGGKGVTNLNRLADIDILIGKNKEAIILIEIEERASSPKKIIGDVFAIAMCDMVAVRVDGKQNDFRITDKTRLIVSGVVPTKGNRKKKIDEVIQSRVGDFSVCDGGVELSNVSLVFEETIGDVLRRLDELLASNLG